MRTRNLVGAMRSRYKPRSKAVAGIDPLALLCRAHGLPQPIREHRFDAVRRWRFDYSWPDRLVAVEQNGGVWTSGRHTRGAGYLKDCEKLNQAQVLGWIVLQFSPQQIQNGDCLPVLKEVLQ